MTVNIHIDQLIVDGLALSEAEQAQLGRSLAAELTTLLSEQPVARWARDWSSLANRPLVLTLGSPEPAALGRQVACAVHTGLRR